MKKNGRTLAMIESMRTCRENSDIVSHEAMVHEPDDWEGFIDDDV